MLPITNLESSDIRTLSRVLEDHRDARTEMRIKKEFLMRDYESKKEMAANELNHNNRLKERLQQLNANNERDQETSNKISSMCKTLQKVNFFNIKLIAEAQVEQFNQSIQVKQTNFEKRLEEQVHHLADKRPLVKAHQRKVSEIAALELSHQKTIEKENAEKERKKDEELIMVTLFQKKVVELAAHVLQYHEIANKKKNLPTQLSPSRSSQSNQMMTLTSTHQEAIVYSQKIQRQKQRRVSDSGFGPNSSKDEMVESSNSKVTATNSMPIEISSEKHNANDVQMVNDDNVVIQGIDEIANARMDDGGDADGASQEIDETSSSYDIAAILQESINFAKTLNIDFNVSDTEYDEESIELLK